MGLKIVVNGRVIDNGSSIRHNEQNAYNSQPDPNANKADPARIANPLIDVQIARANSDADIAAQKAMMDAEIRAATTLTPMGYDQTGRIGAWSVKRSQ